MSFYDRIPKVLSIIEEHEPINYTDLHNKLIKETGKKISKHTLNKCIKFLLFTSHIKKEERIGQGKPVYFKISEFPLKLDIDVDLRRKDLLVKLESGDTESFEYGQFADLNMHIGLLNISLIKELYIYSQNSNTHRAFVDYSEFLHNQFLPSLENIVKLVKPPLGISKEVLVKLLNTVDPVNHIIWIEGVPHKPTFSFDIMTEEEKEEKMLEVTKMLEEKNNVL